MLLVDQVELLRQHVVQLENQRFSLPLMGGPSATIQTYHFKTLVHPARDIATTIAQADPAGNKLPSNLRGWNLIAKDSWGKTKTIHFQKLLGMIIHVYYLNITDNRLDISNDLGERVIVPYDSFLTFVKRLVLTPEHICLVICGLAEERIKSNRGIHALMSDVPGSGDLMHCLSTITRWPPLKETIWSAYFENQGVVVDPGCNTIQDVPFLKGGRHAGRTVLWNVGWRRDEVYATAWIDVSHLIAKIRDYFNSSIGHQ